MLSRRSLSIILSSIFIALGLVAFSQSEQVLLNRDFEYSYQSEIASKNTKSHSSIRPFLYSDVKALGNDSDLYYSPGVPFKKLANKEKSNHPATLTFLPLVNVGFGFESGDSASNYSALGIGASALFKYKDALAVRINASTHKDQLPNYLEENATSKRVTPDGIVYKSNEDGLRYTNINGYLSWNTAKYFNIQVGNGKNFIGSGYRSMLLSDHAGNYGYGKITTSIWRIKYVVLYANQKDINNTMSTKSKDWRNKYSTTHYLSWNLAKWLNVGLFESVVWKAQDTLLNRGFDVNYLNPIIFFRPVEFSTGSSDNSILGLNLEIKPTNKFHIYAQMMLDEFLYDEFMKDVKEAFNPGSQSEYGWWANKHGFQLGFKWYEMFGIPGLGIQSEYNWMRPFTHSHADPIQNYGHQNNSLAHPLGSNFMESITFLNYSVYNWFFQFQFAWYNQGLSTQNENFGEDIYRSYRERENEYGHVTTQGVPKTVTNIGLRTSYLVYPESNLRVFIGARNRMEVINGVQKGALYTEFGISTSLFNSYTDI
ncbi:MAG: hypothetical protein ACPGEG_01530 [Salibacteraceae bacterium]